MQKYYTYTGQLLLNTIRLEELTNFTITNHPDIFHSELTIYEEIMRIEEEKKSLLLKWRKKKYSNSMFSI